MNRLAMSERILRRWQYPLGTTTASCAKRLAFGHSTAFLLELARLTQARQIK
jgi:hypothetical protein